MSVTGDTRYRWLRSYRFAGGPRVSRVLLPWWTREYGGCWIALDSLLGFRLIPPTWELTGWRPAGTKFELIDW